MYRKRPERASRSLHISRISDKLTVQERFALIAGFARGEPMKRTYQPSKIRRARTHGFLARMKSRGGRAVINARRAKGRKRLAV